MVRLLTRLAIGVVCAGSCLAAGAETVADAGKDRHDFAWLADFRLISSDAPLSYLEGGQGKSRFDDEHEGIRIGELALGYRGSWTDRFTAGFDLVFYDDRDGIDLTEAWVQWRQVPTSPWRSRVKVGAFYAPISMENRLPGWRNPYAISNSAINTWIAEEIKTIGAEYRLDWLGRKKGRAMDVSGVFGLYAWNDPAGIIMAFRGWGMHDRQTPVFGTFGDRVIFHEIDDRLGYYVGAEARVRDRFELRALHYDNNGDRVTYDPGIGDLAWDTVFESVGAAWTPTADWTVLIQALDGETSAFPGAWWLWEFESAYVLVSRTIGPHRVTLRLDGFEMEQVLGNPAFLNSDSGVAVTVAYLRELNRRWSVAAEARRLDGRLAARAGNGRPTRATEDVLQFALRFKL